MGKIDTDEKLDMKAFNMTASAELGVRWSLSQSMGLYTGLYIDYGFLNCRPDPINPEKYSVYGFRTKDGTKRTLFLPNVSFGTREWDPINMSIVQAQQSDRIVSKPSDVNNALLDPTVEERSSELADRLSTLGFGLTLRLTFGGATAKAPKNVDIVKPIKVTPPDTVPDDINAKMRELSNTLFAFDKFDLNAKAKGYLDEIAQWLNEHPQLKVEIAGHTDGKGTLEYNQRLSENRAKSVYDYFISKGVSPSRLSYKGYGMTMPIATNDTDEGRQLNRRVELKVVK